MSDKKLRPKYLVFKIGPEGETEDHGMESTDPENVDSPFVLMPRKDPAAFAAVIAYARCCEPDLAKEIKGWMRKIAEAEPVFGTQGRANFVHARNHRLFEIG